MSRIAMQLSEEFLSAVCQMVGVDETPEVLENVAYVILEPVGPAEFNLKMVTETEIFEAAKTDPDLEIISLA